MDRACELAQAGNILNGPSNHTFRSYYFMIGEGGREREGGRDRGREGQRGRKEGGREEGGRAI